jgi:hypothetical protein
MTSPMLTVVVLAVLWLIVVVPMVVRRNDDRARDRSVERFGTSMRALTRRHEALSWPARSRPADPDAASVVAPRVAGPRAELFVTGTRRVDLEPAVRQPVPAAEEALMHPVDRSEMSAARTHMMARRRRSLTILGLGSVASVILALSIGGGMWVPALLFGTGLGGYVYFLRSQALRDRERRRTRQMRAATRGLRDYDATDIPGEMIASPDSAVHIDDDDLELHEHDTVELTGLYAEESAPERAAQRRAS